MQECPKCKGSGYQIVRNPNYKIGSLCCFLMRRECPYCGGRGQISEI